MCAVVTAQIPILILINLAHCVTVVAEFYVPYEGAPRFRLLVRIRVLRPGAVISKPRDIRGHEV
jgi:hypothetical protein